MKWVKERRRNGLNILYPLKMGIGIISNKSYNSLDLW